MSEPSKAVFLSHASQDAEAAARICAGLRAAGIEVWFDQSELRGGDAWDRQIRERIHDCRLFIAVISANTEVRDEGYFRREWKLAVDRTHDMLEKKTFLLPVVIDGTQEHRAAVPDKFLEVQWTRLPGGVSSAEFVARVKRLVTPGSPDSPVRPATLPPEPDPAHPVSVDAFWGLKSYWPVLAVVLVLGVAYVLYYRLQTPPHSSIPPVVPASAGATEKSIAVLPFVDLSEKHDQEYFGDGLAEEILDLLAKIPGLKVVGRTSSFQFRGNSGDLRKIGVALGAVYLVEGSVRKSGDRIRVTVQLIDARDGTHRWSDSYESDTTNALLLQKKIAMAVARELQVSVTDYFATGGATNSPEAHDLYLRGIRDIDYGDREGELRAISELARAVEIDPRYIDAWLGLADAYDSAATDNAAPRAESYRLAQVAVDKVLTLDPNNADAYAMRAFIRMNNWDWTGAEQDIHRAQSLRKRSGAIAAAAKLAVARGNLVEAEALLRDVLATDPLDTYTLTVLAYVVYPAMGRFKDSDLLLSRLREINANAGWINSVQSFNALSEGNHELALQLAKSETDAAEREAAVSIAYTAMGKAVESRQALERLLRIPTATEFRVACVLAYRGEQDLAFQYLEKAYAHHSVDLLYLKTEPTLAKLRSDARYDALLRRMKLPV